MKVVIRADASVDIGTGHVMRCLTLANMLARRGAGVTFICREHAGHLCDQIEAAGFSVSRLKPLAAAQDAALTGKARVRSAWEIDAEQSCEAVGTAAVDLLVVDHYELDERWECALRPMTRRILVLDDLADRRHDCDVLLDSNLHDGPEARYAGLVSPATRVFIGPRYALLRAEFESVAARVRGDGVHQLLVYFGGADPSNEALKVMLALRALAAKAPRAVLVLGPINPHADEIRKAAYGMERIEVLEATRDMAQLMAGADLAAGTCGGAAWERCVVGLPTLVVVNAANQRDDARILHALGAVRNLGDAHATRIERWAAEIDALRANPAALQKMSSASASVMHGRQAAVRELEAALVR